MGKVFSWLANLPAKEQVIEKAERNMHPGDIWHYSLDLKKGTVYSIKIEGCRNVRRMACALSKGNEAGDIDVRHGRVIHHSIQLETLGTYNLSVTLEAIRTGAIAGTVTVTLAKEGEPYTWELKRGQKAGEDKTTHDNRPGTRKRSKKLGSFFHWSIISNYITAFFFYR
jgi:hypothetical protein